jgi:transposase
MSYMRLNMRKIREILRLHFECTLNFVQIGKSCGLSRIAARDCINRFKGSGLPWPTDLDDKSLEIQLYKKPNLFRKDHSTLPEWKEVHKELRRKGVTRYLLWQEYKERDPQGLEFSSFCNLYRRWNKTSDLSMRQTHVAGEKLFVDYAGPTVPIINRDTGEIKEASIFVAVLGASNYTYAEASFSQELPHWITSHVNAFNFFGGVPQIVIPDNLKSGVSKSCRYEPDINRSYNDMALHYGVAVIPARPYKAKDKSKAEVGVQIVERWILAALRDRSFFSLAELNREIRRLLEKLNLKSFQKIEGTRKSLFEELDKPSLKPLPINPYQYAEYKLAKVNVDYHIEYDGHYYSVPYKYVGEHVYLRITASTIEVLCDNKRIASHRLSVRKRAHTTIKEHMPKSHQKYIEWNPERILNWAKTIGPSTGELAKCIMSSRAHPQQGFRSCFGVLRLGESFGKDRLENACKRALSIKSYSYKSVKSILDNGLDTQPLPQETQKTFTFIDHENLRGINILQ